MVNLRGMFLKNWGIQLFLSGIFFVSALAILLIAMKIHDKSVVDQPHIQISTEEKLWFEQIKLLGGNAAYGKFKEKYSVDYPQDIHYLAHIFGISLYKSEGEMGINVCDPSFAFGCYHGLIVSALNKSGLGVINKLNEECIKRSGPSETGCRHGIGHGLLEFLGSNKLNDALIICRSLQKVSQLGCTQGVFMEYNRPGMMDSGNEFLGLRKLVNEDRLLLPCKDLDREFHNSCYYEQSQWWLGLYKDYEKVGMLCGGVEAEESRRSCFLGIGVNAAQATGYDVEETIKLCNKMPKKQDEVDCRSAAGWVFKVNPKFNKKAFLLCEGVETGSYNKCVKNLLPPNEINLADN